MNNQLFDLNYGLVMSWGPLPTCVLLGRSIALSLLLLTLFFCPINIGVASAQDITQDTNYGPAINVRLAVLKAGDDLRIFGRITKDKRGSEDSILVLAKDFSQEMGGPGKVLTLSIDNQNNANLGDSKFSSSFQLRGNSAYRTQIAFGPGSDKVNESKASAQLCYDGWLWLIPREERSSNGDRSKRGKVEWLLINRVPIEKYLEGVVGAEMPESSSIKALQAQAIVSRTYALHALLESKNPYYDLQKDVRSQVYRGLTQSKRVIQAVRTTRGQLVTYRNQVFQSFFHSTCGGSTSNGQSVFEVSSKFPGFSAVQCDFCKKSSLYRWKDKKIAEATLRERLIRRFGRSLTKLGLRDPGKVKSITPIDVKSDGRCAWVRVIFQNGQADFNSNDFRVALNWKSLPSTNFNCKKSGDYFLFTGKGFGHGVGMCQWGAMTLGAAGYDAVAIIEYYYKECQVQVFW